MSLDNMRLIKMSQYEMLISFVITVTYSSIKERMYGLYKDDTFYVMRQL